MVQCFVADCNHSYSKNQCSFYRLPADIMARRKWEQLSGRPPDCSNENSRICSCHFIGGIKSAAPSLFKWTQNKSPCFPDSFCGVKEEPEEKEIMSAQGCPGRPTDQHDDQLQTAIVDKTTGLTVQQIITHLKEETDGEVTPSHFSDMSHW